MHYLYEKVELKSVQKNIITYQAQNIITLLDCVHDVACSINNETIMQRFQNMKTHKKQL